MRKLCQKRIITAALHTRTRPCKAFTKIPLSQKSRRLYIEKFALGNTLWRYSKNTIACGYSFGQNLALTSWDVKTTRSKRFVWSQLEYAWLVLDHHVCSLLWIILIIHTCFAHLLYSKHAQSVTVAPIESKLYLTDLFMRRKTSRQFLYEINQANHSFGKSLPF